MILLVNFVVDSPAAPEPNRIGSSDIRASSFHESGLKHGSSCSPA
jgi:hypothetical protein